MILWIAMAALAAAACLPLLASLTRAGIARPRSAPAMAIYRDQLAELDRDLARGVVAESEVSAARTEIARRLLREDESRMDSGVGAESGRPPRVAAGLIIAMPLAALAAYLVLGSPQYPDQPLSARPEVATAREVDQLVTKVEAHLAEFPDDGQGWEVIAPVYARLGRTADAVTAYRNALSLLGATAERESDLGEAIVRQEGGTVTPEARAAFERASKLAPEDPRPKFYLALALGQEGRKDEAVAAWQALLAGAPADASWRPAAEQALAALSTRGPTAAEVDAAAGMTPADRNAMIAQMVDTLAERLKTAPDDGEGWARLVRSYMVLGRTTDAQDALRRARNALSGDTAKLALVEAAAREAGIGERP